MKTALSAPKRRPSSLKRSLVSALLGLTLFSTVTVLAAAQTPAAAQSGVDTTMLLFDLSGSMGEIEPDGRTRLAIAQEAMIEAIGGLTPGSENIGIRSFSACGVSTLEQAPGPVDQALLAATINSFRPQGGTDIALALSNAPGDFANSTGRNSVILLSDGAHNCGGDPCVTATNLIASGIDIIVHAIGIGTAGTEAENQLGCIAQVTGGTVVSVDGADELFDAIDTVITGAATSASVSIQTPVSTCINSARVQSDASLGANRVGDVYTDSNGLVRVLITGEECGFACTDGFDINCDGELHDFCNSDFDITTVSGVGRCLEELGEDATGEDTSDEEGDSTRKSLDEILEQYCVNSSSVSDALENACEHYLQGKNFEDRADAARATGDAFLTGFNEVLAEEALESARAALAEAMAVFQDDGAEFVTALASVTEDWSEIPGGDPADWDDEELRLMLDTIGINFDPDRIALKTAAGIPDLLDATPDWLKAELFTAGWEVSATATLPLGSFPPGNLGLLSPVAGSADATVTASTKLTDPQIGIGFTNTQVFEVAVEARLSVGLSAGKPKIFSLVGRLKKVGISTPLQRLIDSSRVLSAVDKLPLGVTWDGFVGAQMKWETAVSAEQAAANGANDLPDLYDPATFEIGNSVLIRGSEISGTSFSAKYKAHGIPWTIAGELVELNGLGWGAARLDQNTFAVYSGPIEGVQSQLFAGIQKGITVGVTGSRELSFADYRYAELDMRTEAGQAAYLSFAQGYGVPATDGPGVRTADFEEITLEQELGFSLQVGFIDVRPTTLRTEAVRTTTNFSDGTQETTAVYSYPGAQVSLVAPLLPNGQPDVEQAVATFVVADMNESRAGNLALAFGAELPPGENYHVQFTLTGAEIQEYRERAQAWIAANDGARPVEDPLTDPLASFSVRIGSASDVEEAIYVFTRQLVTSPENMIIDFAGSAVDVSYPATLSGTVEFKVVS